MLFDKLQQEPISKEIEPVFIVGCGHSGTTLMTAILNSHPKLYAINYETSLFSYINSRKKIYKTIEEFYNDVQNNGANHMIEKTPRHLHQISRILHYYPRARVISMVRDGRDVACSIKKRTGSFSEGAKRWEEDNKELIKHLDDERVLLVKYEDIIEDFECAIRKVIEFLNEEYIEELKNHHKKGYNYLNIKDKKKPEDAFGDNHNTYRAWQVNQPVYDARNRWRKEMTLSERERFIEQANDLLVYFGYESGGKW